MPIIPMSRDYDTFIYQDIHSYVVLGQRFLNIRAIPHILLKNLKWVFRAKKELKFSHFNMKGLKIA
jgi:hypothetical protein